MGGRGEGPEAKNSLHGRTRRRARSKKQPSLEVSQLFLSETVGAKAIRQEKYEIAFCNMHESDEWSKLIP